MSSRHQMRGSRWTALAAAIALAVLAPRVAVAAPTSITTCPATIMTPGAYRLDVDPCTGTPAITIDASNVTLDLNGKTVDADGTGISVNAGKTGIAITNGTITDVFFGILLNGNSRVRVERVTFTNCVHGINAINGFASDSTFAHNRFVAPANSAVSVNGDRNHFYFNTVEGGNGGLFVEGSDNRFICNRTSGTDTGIGAVGDRNHFVSNTISGGTEGILVTGDDNVLRRNRTVGQMALGIVLDNASERNLVEVNYSLGPGIDMYDEDANFPTCPNTWRRNLFVDDNEGDGPHAGCIQ